MIPLGAMLSTINRAVLQRRSAYNYIAHGKMVSEPGLTIQAVVRIATRGGVGRGGVGRRGGEGEGVVRSRVLYHGGRGCI